MELSYQIMQKLYGMSIFEINIPTLFLATNTVLPSGITLYASQFQLPPSTQTINDPLNHLVVITNGSYDDF